MSEIFSSADSLLPAMIINHQPISALVNDQFLASGSAAILATPFPTSPRAAMIAAAVGVSRFFFL